MMKLEDEKCKKLDLAKIEKFRKPYEIRKYGNEPAAYDTRIRVVEKMISSTQALFVCGRVVTKKINLHFIVDFLRKFMEHRAKE
jgi:hypothetical protein